ncbi:hypothetical protein CTI12_AA483680 [Artemisia annua]|uniref:TF-B3 domain-containing protein n=1 Tax=Artemisia annua TaxID=35608 RepID=A0A2U1LEI8_ARTAN|nr:hypothetical protein CTI12_AA483680 [Artemisia annua]
MSEPVKYFPQALSVLIQTKVSFDRTNCFSLRMSLKVRRCYKIRLQHGDLRWNSEVPLLTLTGTNIEVKEGQKFVICGPVGAGKSSLLYIILQKEPELQELAVGSLIRGRELPDLVPWLLDILKSDGSNVERSGAAQGLSEAPVRDGYLTLFKVAGTSGKALLDDEGASTEAQGPAIIEVLGRDKRNEVLAALYMVRTDISLSVRQEIMPVSMNTLIASLALPSSERRPKAYLYGFLEIIDRFVILFYGTSRSTLKLNPGYAIEGDRLRDEHSVSELVSNMAPAKLTNTSQVAEEYPGTAFKKCIPHGPPRLSDLKDASGRISSSDAIRIATTYCPTWPNFINVMQDPPSKNSLYVPSYFGTHLPDKLHQLKFLNKGKSWTITVTYNKSNKSHHFHAGWPEFRDANEIRYGDICIFELLGKCEVNVLILKVKDPSKAYVDEVVSRLDKQRCS